MYTFKVYLLGLQLIQQSLEEQQKRVDSLQHMVVVVDDSNADSGGKFHFVENSVV